MDVIGAVNIDILGSDGGDGGDGGGGGDGEMGMRRSSEEETRSWAYYPRTIERYGN